MKIKNTVKKVIAAVLFVSALFFFAAAGLSGLAAAAPLQGIYDYGDISSVERLANLDKMGAAGLDLVLCYTSGSAGNSPAELTAYLDRAQKNGLRVIWDFNELIGDANASAEAARVVNVVKDHPATWGYCVGDEHSSSQAGSALKMSQAIRVADPNHPRMYIGTYQTGSLTAFVPCADYLGLYVYPIGESTDSAKMVAEVGTTASSLKAFNNKQGKKTIIVLQAFDWASDPSAPADWKYKRAPTRTEMRQMRDLAIAKGDPEIIMWFSYYRMKGNEGLWKDFVWAATGNA